MRKARFIHGFLIVYILVEPICTNGQQGRDIGSSDPVKTGTFVFNVGWGVECDYKRDYYDPGLGIKIIAEWGLWRTGPGTVTLGGEAGGTFSSGGHYYNYTSRLK